MNCKPVALFILDGWGIRERESNNAVVQAHTPNYHNWLRTRERAVLDASGEVVGLPDGQMGNSEVGHLNLGAGRIVYQNFTRINMAIRDGSFYDISVLLQAIEQVKVKGGKLHLIGLLGEGGVHSHSDHLFALIELADKNGVEPIVHLISDGRDTPPHSAADFVQDLESCLAANSGVIASVCGRYYTMDRDKRWPRTQKGYELITRHIGEAGATAESAAAAIQQSHKNGVTDEFILPVAIGTGDKNVLVEPGDGLIFYNFRADRMRQIVTAFLFPDFDGFERDFIENLHIVTMTAYEDDFDVNVIFPEQEIKNPLAEVLSKAGLKQFHAAETEKYAHVTYFFNGGKEAINPGEERHLEPSPKVATYDLQPEMSAYPLTEVLLDRIHNHDDDFILVNFANPDMVGHTGVLEAAVKAVETVDECAGKLVEAVVAKGGVALVTADHGNCEIMVDEKTGSPHTYHTTQPVSFFVINNEYVWLRPRGILADVAPTVLDLLGVVQAAEMSGRSLIE
ncbi:MAG: 2,3-bisphosphoglycerate-independent phosphoglycerate mutase [Chloroflexi bacterium]|nr:2,3-bisphosphoglycerate-independent phosphoglycerate mutase [Chloroflexota bacterium]